MIEILEPSENNEKEEFCHQDKNYLVFFFSIIIFFKIRSKIYISPLCVV